MSEEESEFEDSKEIELEMIESARYKESQLKTMGQTPCFFVPESQRESKKDKEEEKVDEEPYLWESERED